MHTVQVIYAYNPNMWQFLVVCSSVIALCVLSALCYAKGSSGNTGFQVFCGNIYIALHTVAHGILAVLITASVLGLIKFAEVAHV